MHHRPARSRRALTGVATLAVLSLTAMSASALAPAAPEPQLGPTVGGTTVEVELPPVYFTSVSADNDGNFAAFDTDGRLWTWGQNDSRVLLQGEDGAPSAAAPADTALTADLVAVDLTTATGLGLTADGTVRGWGLNMYGELGVDPATMRSTTTPVDIALPGPAVAVAMGDSYASYALLADGTVWAWGSSSYGQLGEPDEFTVETAPRQVPIPVDVVALDAGYGTAAAVGTDGQVYTWGNNAYGQLGREASVDGDPTPAPVPGLTGVTELSVSSFNIGVIADGQAYTWGENSYAQVGNGEQGVPVTTPAALDLPGGTAVSVGLGTFNGTAVDASGGIWTWGMGIYGALGNGETPMYQPSPTRATTADGLGLAEIAVGGGVTFGLDAEGRLYTWGVNDVMQLGGGEDMFRSDAHLLDLGLTATAMTLDGTPVTDLATSWPYATGTAPAHPTGPVDVVISAVDRNGTAVNDWTWAAGFSYQVTVSFDTRGGSAIDPMVVSTPSIPLPADPTLAGMIFSGWALDPEGTQPFDPTMSLTDDLTLYATWEAAPPVVTADPTPEPADPTPAPVDPAASAGPAAQDPVQVRSGVLSVPDELATTGVTVGAVALAALAALLGGGLLIRARRGQR